MLLQVRIAQQDNDNACLAHALASLCSIIESTTPGTIEATAEDGAAASVPAKHHAHLLRLLTRWEWTCMFKTYASRTAEHD